MKDENKKKIQEGVRMILEAIGENPDRAGLLETPKRVANMYEEVFSGLIQPDSTEYKVFDTINDSGMVLIKDIEFFSMCEHHLLPFFGKAHVAYVPDQQRVIGLSKIPRIVEYASKRPSLQENLTTQIANKLVEKISPKGVAVLIEADHMCMAMRGVRSSNTTTITTHYQGIFLEDKEMKRDFLREVKE